MYYRSPSQFLGTVAARKIKLICHSATERAEMQKKKIKNHEFCKYRSLYTDYSN